MTIQFRRGTDAEATSNNPVLALGEPGYTEEGTFKIGDGTTAWNDLDAIPIGAYGTTSRRFNPGRIYLPDNGSTAATNAPSNEQLRVAKFTVDLATTIDELSVRVVGAGESGSVLRLGVYADDGSGEPAALVLDAGTVAADTTGVKTVTSLATDLAAGVYWVGAAVQSAPSTAPTVISCGLSGPATALTDVLHLTLRDGYVQNSVSGALPDPMVPSSTTALPPPCVFVKVS